MDTRVVTVVAVLFRVLTALIPLQIFLVSGSAIAGKLYMTISVDWEGRDLDSENLTVFKNFRSAFPGLPLLHFLNPAYFTKPYADSDQIVRKIKSVMRAQDETGLHIHSWKSLVENSGVSYRHFPKWTPRVYHDSQVRACSFSDCGHEVPLWAYSFPEIRQIIRFSKNTLEHYGFGRAVSFRAGGWMASPEVIAALGAEGFRFDSSAVPADLFRSQLDGYSIPAWVRQLWPGTTLLSQPYQLDAGNFEIFEMPDNGCLADYTTANDMMEVFNKNLAVWRADPDQNIFIHFGFHQETAQFYLVRIADVLTRILSKAKAEQIPIVFTTFDQIGITKF